MLCYYVSNERQEQHLTTLQNTMKTETYNGWTNYATWRVNLELFDNWNDDPMDADTCQEFAEMVVIESTPELENTLAEGYIRSFLSDVNWHEIAEATNQN